MILNIPHSSTLIPAEFRDQLVLSDQELAAEIIRVTDSYTDELFRRENASMIIFPVNRLLIDPERFLDDAKEPMSAVGMGVVYTKTSQGTELRHKLTIKAKQKLIDQYYVPHHTALTRAVKSELETEGRALIIDCHSFPSSPLPCEFAVSLSTTYHLELNTHNSPVHRPDICIGSDEFHTPHWLSGFVNDLCTSGGFSTKFNSPYPGTIVPLDYYGLNPAVSSIMIEINRRLYMDEKTGMKNQSFCDIHEKIDAILEKVDDGWRKERGE